MDQKLLDKLVEAVRAEVIRFRSLLDTRGEEVLRQALTDGVVVNIDIPNNQVEGACRVATTEGRAGRYVNLLRAGVPEVHASDALHRTLQRLLLARAKRS